MRVKLWHRVFALTALATLLAVATMLVVQQHSLRRGLLDYVNQLDRERAQGLLPLLAAEYREVGDWSRLRANPPRFRWLLEQAGLARGDDLAPPDVRGPGPGAGRRGGPPPGIGAAGPPGPGDRPRRPYALFDAEGVAVIGPARPWQDALALPIEVDGRTVGRLLLRPLPRLESSWDIDFARSQLMRGVATAALVLVLAIVASIVFARRLVAPLRRMADRARRIAGGDYAARVAIERSDEIGELARDFDAMAQALQRSRDARQRWTAEISHELRTPIAVMRAELDALEDGIRQFDAAALRSLGAEAERLSRLVEDLYQLSLADSGALAYQFEDLDLARLLAEGVETHAGAFERARLQLETQLPATAPVRADGGRVLQLIANLSANSCRYTDAGGRVRVSLEDRGSCWRICWDDSAPGVPVDALSRLFEPLYRVDASRNRASGGAGLGLAICRRIAAAHGASMTAEASPLGGLRIVIDWPKP